jgi:hypothetical protein
MYPYPYVYTGIQMYFDYQVYQELCQNANKYANSKEVHVVLMCFIMLDIICN